MFDFGNHLRMLRERYGISQEELGRRVGRIGHQQLREQYQDPYAGCPHDHGSDL